jgi:reactive intermediate/imine deaminase
MQKVIHFSDAPKAIGPYSQAVQAGNMIFISGQIPLDPKTGELNSSMITEQTHRVLKNLRAICQAAGGDLKNLVKVTIYLVDLSHFEIVNQVMKSYFEAPYPARVTLGVSSLPRQAGIEIDGIMVV